MFKKSNIIFATMLIISSSYSYAGATGATSPNGTYDMLYSAMDVAMQCDYVLQDGTTGTTPPLSYHIDINADQSIPVSEFDSAAEFVDTVIENSDLSDETKEEAYALADEFFIELTEGVNEMLQYYPDTMQITTTSTTNTSYNVNVVITDNYSGEVVNTTSSVAKVSGAYAMSISSMTFPYETDTYSIDFNVASQLIGTIPKGGNLVLNGTGAFSMVDYPIAVSCNFFESAAYSQTKR